MNKDTYNSLKKLLEQATKEAWGKYYDLAKKGEIGHASSYCDLYNKIYLLHIDLENLIENEEEEK